MNSINRYKVKTTSLLQTYALVAVLILLTSFLAYITAGALFAGISIFVLVAVYILVPSTAPEVLTRFFRARKLSYTDAPLIHKAVHYLSYKAGLPARPDLFIIPSNKPAAFATGTTKKSGIAISSGLINLLNKNELAGVLGHEISHIANNDIRVMWFAMIINRATGILSVFGQVLVIINLPLILFSGLAINWLIIGLLVFAPTLAFILQLTLSRVREYSADMGSAELLGSPAPLISALQKIDGTPRTFWGNFVYSNRKKETSSLFSTHPPTKERIKRLMALKENKPVFIRQKTPFPTHRRVRVQFF